MANLQLLVLLISLTLNIRTFCGCLLRTRAFLVFAIVYTVLSYVDVLVRPDQTMNFLSLYTFGQSFKFCFAGVAAAGLVVYVLLVNGTRRLLEKHQLCKVQPAI